MMKNLKYYILQLLLILVSFSSFSNAEIAGRKEMDYRLYSHIDGQKIDLSIIKKNCGKEINSSRISNMYSVNITIDKPLVVGKFYYMNFGLGFNYYYLKHIRQWPNDGDDYYSIFRPENVAKIKIINDCLQNSNPRKLDVRNFIVNENVNQNYSKGTKFDYDFQIKGDYTYATHGYHQIDLVVYYDSVSSSNEIGRIYWNREDDENLIFNSYTTQKMWVTSLINYNTKPRKKFILVAKYAGITKQFTYTIPEGDNDNDGVLNSQDNCPNVAGPASNNGCPVVDTGYDLRLKESNVTVMSNCFNCNSQLNLLNPRFAGGIFPVNKHLMEFTQGGSIGSVTMHFTIENIGTSASEPVEVNFYLSKNYNSTQGLKAKKKTVKIPSIKAHKRYSVSADVNYDDFQTQQGNYYIVIDVEPGSKDANKKNNFVNIPTALKCKYCSKQNLYTKHKIGKPYDVSVFTISGMQIVKKTVTTKEEENMVVQNLPKGFYIIKNDIETYKVAK